MKKIAVLVLSFVLMLTVTSCSKQSNKNLHIIMVNALNGHPVYEQQAEAAKKAAEDYGADLEITGPVIGCEDVLSEYVKCMENAIEAKPDAIICEPFEPAVYEYVKMAHDNGIPVFCTSAGTDNSDDYIAYCGTDNVQYGIDAADYVAEKTGGNAKILVVMTNDKNVEQMKQLTSIKDRIDEKYPNMEVVTNVYDDASEEKATEVIGEALKAHCEIDTVIMLEATGGPVAADVANELEREILILDIDSGEKTINNILNGNEWASMVQNFYKRGYETVRMAYEYVTNDGKTEYEKFENSSVVFITKENAANCEKVLWDEVRLKEKSWNK